MSKFLNKNSVFINDGTPGGTVKVDIETVGNSNFEATRITNTYTGSSATKVVNKMTGESFVSKNVVGTSSTTALTTIGQTGSTRNTSVQIPRGSTTLIPYTATLSQDNSSSLQFKGIVPENTIGNTGNGQQQIGTQGKSGNNNRNNEYKGQENTNSNKSNGGSSDSKKNKEQPVKNDDKIYTLETQNRDWNFKSEIPKTVVKNSEGNYTLGRNNEWSVNNTVTSVKQISENQNNIYNIELNNGITPGYTLIRKDDIKVIADENKINNHQKTVTLGSNKKSPISGGHDLEVLDDFFMRKLDIQNGIVVNTPEFKIKTVENLGNGIYEVNYLKLAEDRGSTEVRYRENLRSKTVLDPEIHNIETLTKKVFNKVQNVITQNDVNRALTSRNPVPLDINVDGMQIRTYIRVNPKTGEINIENYHLDATKRKEGK